MDLSPRLVALPQRDISKPLMMIPLTRLFDTITFDLIDIIIVRN